MLGFARSIAHRVERNPVGISELSDGIMRVYMSFQIEKPFSS